MGLNLRDWEAMTDYMVDDDRVNLTVIAAALGEDRLTVNLWRHRGTHGFPAEDGRMWQLEGKGGVPFWYKTTVEAWARTVARSLTWPVESVQ